MKKPVRDIFDQPSVRFSRIPRPKSLVPARVTQPPNGAETRTPRVSARPPRATTRPPHLTARPPQGARDLRRAFVLLVKKLESLGIDCSEVTAIIGDTET